MKIFLFVIAFLSTQVFAQQTVTTTGGEATGSGGSSSFTVGQVAYTSNTGSNGTSNQGVQQVYTLVDGISELTLGVKAYPNPSNGLVTIEISEFAGQSIDYRVTDLLGKEISSSSIFQVKTTIDFSEYESGTYIIVLADDQGKTFKYRLIKQ